MSTTPLRTRQKEVARLSILEAAADEIVDRGIEGVSLQEVADRAGVSKRTLYNYFDSREALFSALTDWSDELAVQHGGARVPNGMAGLPWMMRTLWRSWHAQGSVFQAAVAIEAATHHGAEVTEGRRRRRDAFAADVQAVRPDLADADARQLGAVLHAMASAPVFHRLTVEDAFEVDEAAGAVGWVMNIMREALERGDDPFAFRATQGEDQ